MLFCKERLKKTCFILGLAIFVLGSSVSAHAAKKINLKAGHVLPENHAYHIAWTKVAEIVKEKSEGNITIDVFPNSTLGNERDLIEGMQLGAVDLAVVSTGPMASFSSAFLVLDLPYIFPTYESAYRVLDGEVGQSMLDSLSKNMLKGFCYWENGFRHVTAKKACPLPQDVRGLKIRTMEAEVHMATFNNLGSIATPMAWGEVYTALQQGTIDAQENPIPNIYQGRIQEVNPYVTLTGHFYAASPVLMSKRVWDKLSPEQQRIMSDAILEAQDLARDSIKKIEEEGLAKMKEEGVNITKNVDIDVWREAVQKTYDQYEKRIGKELIEKVQKIAAGE